MNIYNTDWCDTQVHALITFSLAIGWHNTFIQHDNHLGNDKSSSTQLITSVKRIELSATVASEVVLINL